MQLLINGSILFIHCLRFSVSESKTQNVAMSCIIFTIVDHSSIFNIHQDHHLEKTGVKSYVFASLRQPVCERSSVIRTQVARFS